jgi:hypothetical protein
VHAGRALACRCACAWAVASWARAPVLSPAPSGSAWPLTRALAPRVHAPALLRSEPCSLSPSLPPSPPLPPGTSSYILFTLHKVLLQMGKQLQVLLDYEGGGEQDQLIALFNYERM